jgi:hypothetical protein
MTDHCMQWPECGCADGYCEIEASRARRSDPFIRGLFYGLMFGSVITLCAVVAFMKATAVA